MYQINLNFAFDLNYNRSNHNYSVNSVEDGDLSVNMISIRGRYFPTFANQSDAWSPYFIFGISRNFMSIQQRNQTLTSQIDVNGYEGGLGARFALANDRVFFDVQGIYKSLDTPSSGEIQDSNLQPTGLRFEGDEVSLITSVSFIL
ncbi:MAG: outer membrane beta-barrel protein [Bdellovibrionales bacterium]|nr:outer membrane beta-barrel protein [Bdellovibrionales bacterium]NQZ18723.1 outer membrane beta-barrel protein [Bdellovibrionales bacterium]